MGSIVLKQPWIETPLLESSILSRAAGCRVFLKLENLQPSTSFKSRGIGNLILANVREASSSASDLHFYSSSGGNAGLACVTAASSLGYPSTVVVPTSTEESMIIKLKAAGAKEVISHGLSWAYADQHLREAVMPAAEKRGERGIYVPPFDHPLVWEGAGTMIAEIQKQMPGAEKPDAIVCSVGGGGLFCGVMVGLDRVGWGDSVQVMAVETKGADSLAQSVQQNELITLPSITSIALSLGAVRVADQAFQFATKRKNVKTVVLEDAEAAMACARFADDERFVVEAACGASVALAYDGKLRRLLSGFSPDKKVVIVVCGGTRITVNDLVAYREKYAARAEELNSRAAEDDVPSDVTA